MLMWWRSDVNLSFFLCLALCRMRSSACDTVPRLCVRPVLCWLAFPLVSALEALDLVEFARNCLRNHVIHCQAGRCQRYIDTLDCRWVAGGPVIGKFWTAIKQCLSRLQFVQKTSAMGHGFGLILHKRLQDAFQHFRYRCCENICKVAPPSQSLPDEIDNFAHPNLFENIGWLQITGHAGEQVVVGCSILAREKRWWPEYWKAIGRLKFCCNGGLGSIWHEDLQ